MKEQTNQMTQELKSKFYLENLMPVLSEQKKQDIIAYNIIYEKYFE